MTFLRKERIKLISNPRLYEEKWKQCSNCECSDWLCKFKKCIKCYQIFKPVSELWLLISEVQICWPDKGRFDIDSQCPCWSVCTRGTPASFTSLQRTGAGRWREAGALAASKKEMMSSFMSLGQSFQQEQGRSWLGPWIYSHCIHHVCVVYA